MAGELTPMMIELRAMYKEARNLQQEALDNWQRHRQEEDELEDQCNRRYYSTILQTEGNMQTRKAEAEMAVVDLRLQQRAAKTLADAAKKAHTGHTAALSAIESMGHAYNRELKTFGG